MLWRSTCTWVSSGQHPLPCSTGRCNISTWDCPPGTRFGCLHPITALPPLPFLECHMELKSGALLTQSSKCLRKPIGKFLEQSKDSLLDVLRRALAHFLAVPPSQTLLLTRSSCSYYQSLLSLLLLYLGRCVTFNLDPPKIGSPQNDFLWNI